MPPAIHPSGECCNAEARDVAGHAPVRGRSGGRRRGDRAEIRQGQDGGHVKDGDKEATYKLTEKTKVSITDKDGNTTEGKLENLTKRLENLDKAKNKLKLDITTKGDEITEVKMRGGKKKQ